MSSPLENAFHLAAIQHMANGGRPVEPISIRRACESCCTAGLLNIICNFLCLILGTILLSVFKSNSHFPVSLTIIVAIVAFAGSCLNSLASGFGFALVTALKRNREKIEMSRIYDYISIARRYAISASLVLILFFAYCSAAAALAAFPYNTFKTFDIVLCILAMFAFVVSFFFFVRFYLPIRKLKSEFTHLEWFPSHEKQPHALAKTDRS